MITKAEINVAFKINIDFFKIKLEKIVILIEITL